ncbi:MAG: hypothetical protein KatS3mg013_0085 [Actinomycetota bacterium]|nr:MAG: hypothetical protein KatS3mg013_0085 [Actinomycetota bacterium]
MPEAVPSASVAAAEPGLRAGPWPASASFAEGLRVGGVAVAALVERFGTPLVVVDADEVRARMRRVRRAFPRAAYAVKAFTAHAVVRLALEEDLDLLCASGGELEACLRAGAPGERLFLHGNAKTDDELRAALEAGVRWVIVDHGQELARLAELARAAGRVQPVLLRVIPEVEVRTHEAIATGHERSKFGTPLEEVPALARRAIELSGVRIDGYHAHAGSQLLQVEPYVRVLDALLGIAGRVHEQLGLAPRALDVGGGFGVAYTHEPALDPTQVGGELAERLAARCACLGLPTPELVAEPGRWVVANAALTVYRVVARKRVGDRELVAVDGGMSDNLRPMLYGAAYTVAPVVPRPGPARRVSLVGRHCESGDVLADDVELPDALGPGDLVAVAATGAYGYALASAYNRVGRPAVVAVEGGRAVPWLRREDAADLDRLEVAPPRSLPAPAPPSGVAIRPARPSDARSFLELWRGVVAEGRWLPDEQVHERPRAVFRRFRRSWSAEGAEIVAVEAGRVVGHLALDRERHPAHRHVATLGMVVAAERRGRGIGTAMLAVALRWAREVGVRKLVLSVYPDNVRAIALYRRFGFVEEGRLARRSRTSYGYRDEVVMARWVDEEPTGGRA